MRNDITAREIRAEYDKGRGYKESVGLYESVRKCERFYEGDQWKGLKSMGVRPIIMNFTRRLFAYFCAMVVSDDIGIGIEPFLPGDEAQSAADALKSAVERVIERQKIKTRNREALRDAGVDGDACFYFWFDSSQGTGMGGVQGDIRAELVMNTNVIFGNPYSPDAQDQPYIIIARRRPVGQVREEAKRDGAEGWERIEGETAPEFKGEEETQADRLATELTRFWKEDGEVWFARSCGDVLTREPAATGMKLYPIAWMCWMTKKNSCHGVRCMEELIPTQIAVNQMWTAVNLHIQGLAFPKVVYNIQKFPDGWNGAPGRAVGVNGEPEGAATSLAGGVPLPNAIMDVLERTIATARDCAGASDAALGLISRPDNKGAIQAVQQASAAPLELQKLGFYQFVEDYVRVIIDMIHAFYGVRDVKVKRRDMDPETGEETERDEIVRYDFSNLPVEAMDLNVNVGPASYWSEVMRSATLDAMLNAGIIQDAVDYLERVPEDAVPDKAGLIEKMKRRQKAERERAERENAERDSPPGTMPDNSPAY